MVGPLTVDFTTSKPDPLFGIGIANWLMMDHDWALANGAVGLSLHAHSSATFSANGTGPFRLVGRTPDVATELARCIGWWDAAPTVERVAFRPLASDATRVAALLSGEVDMIEPAPLSKVPRLDQNPEIEIHSGIKSRAIMLGFDHASDGPLADVRVREAIYRAIDADAIVARPGPPNGPTRGAGRQRL